MENDKLVVFILTHGRPNNVKTLKTLQKCGYSGKVYFIVDNEDKTINEYIKSFGIEWVKIFDKKSLADEIDEANNFDDRRTITHARNYCFKLANELGIKYFIQLDDDYTSFEFRYISDDGQKLLVKKITDIDFIFNKYLEFYKSTNFKTIAFAQGGDFIGGVQNPYVIRRPLMRKAMNSFICSTDRPFQFVGTFNEDVNTYCTLGNKGELFGTIPMISLVQTATQSNKSGITEMYLRFGTYCKAFTTLMMHPSGVKVAMLNSENKRIHHAITWNNTTPMIISERHRK